MTTKTEKKNTLPIHATIATNLPNHVYGIKSPYPTVVMVITISHTQSYGRLNFVSGNGRSTVYRINDQTMVKNNKTINVEISGLSFKYHFIANKTFASSIFFPSFT